MKKNDFKMYNVVYFRIEEILADSDEEDDEDDVKSKKENRESRKRKSAWIQEESDKILDFTDPGVSKKITSKFLN